MRILCIDDSIEEIRRAEAAIKSAGHEPERFCVADQRLHDALDCIAENDAVISDLFFNAVWANHPAYVRQKDLLPPAGLLVVIHARALGKPVALCTSMDSGDGGRNDRENHHGWRYGWLDDGSNGRKTGYHLPLIGRKDWGAAVDSILKQATEPAQ